MHCAELTQIFLYMMFISPFIFIGNLLLVTSFVLVYSARFCIGVNILFRFLYINQRSGLPPISLSLTFGLLYNPVSCETFKISLSHRTITSHFFSSEICTTTFLILSLRIVKSKARTRLGVGIK